MLFGLQFVVFLYVLADSVKVHVSLIHQDHSSHHWKEQKPLFSFRFLIVKVNLSNLVDFAYNLATLLSSGVALLRSLQVVASQTPSIELRGILNKIAKDVEPFIFDSKDKQKVIQFVDYFRQSF